MSIDKIFCVQCETSKQASEFDRKGEHILPRGFGNDGEQPVVLKDKICHECNQDYGKVIDQPFLRCVTSREIQKEHGMKRRKEKNTLIITGSGVIAEYKTTTAHLFECIKIAFGTHILILGEEYRDNIFHSLRKVLSDTIIEYNTLKENLKSDLPPKRDLNEMWADTIQPLVASKCFNVIRKQVHGLNKVARNSDEIIAKFEARSEQGSYASLIQLGCWSFGIGVMVCLQSLPPIIIHVSDEIDRYIKDFGRERIHFMDLRSAGKWVGCES